MASSAQATDHGSHFVNTSSKLLCSACRAEDASTHSAEGLLPSLLSEHMCARDLAPPASLRERDPTSNRPFNGLTVVPKSTPLPVDCSSKH